MQSVSAGFTARTIAPMRPITWAVLMSFDKDFDDNIDFFTIGTSTLGGTDILKGVGSVVQEWDKYTYDPYSDRVMSIEINRETDPPTNPICLAQATIVLDNHDDMFTPGNTASPLDGKLLPRRPVRINLGFGGETIPKFVGLTEGRPTFDDKAKTVTFQCVDFLSFIYNLPLDQEIMYQDMRTDEIIAALLQSVAGLVSSQYSLDYGGTVIPFAYFKKGTKLGKALRDLAEAELGNVRMREDGVIIFENRQNWFGSTPEWVFDRNNILERSDAGDMSVINVVEVYSEARAVQDKQSVYQVAGLVRFSDQTDTLAPGATKIVFIDFKDDYGALPVTTMDDPVAFDVATTSLYGGNTESDGSGTDTTSDVDLTDSVLFSTGALLEFTNNGSVDTFINQLEIFGTPARVVNNIYLRVQNDASVGTADGYEEQPVEIRNDLIQDATAANTIGTVIIEDRGEDDDTQQWIIKAVPQLQIGDMATYEDADTDEDYFVTRLNDIINSSGYRQVVVVSKRTINTYFRIGISTIGGTDSIGP